MEENRPVDSPPVDVDRDTTQDTEPTEVTLEIPERHEHSSYDNEAADATEDDADFDAEERDEEETE